MPVVALREPPEPASPPGGGRQETPESAHGRTDVEPVIRCAACGHVLTHERERTRAAGNHRHVFANPHGIVFEIEIFRRAPGCRHTGPATTEWSWFSGTAWRLALCGACLTHVGWHYVSAAADPFYGLIRERLVGTGG